MNMTTYKKLKYDNYECAVQVAILDGAGNNIATGKQATLSSTQLNACNSGIDASKVATYDTYASQIAGKQTQLTTAQLNACNSGIDTAKVSTYDGYASQIAGKQATLPTTTTAGLVLKSTSTSGTVEWGQDTESRLTATDVVI